jgi:toxin ParE1/3/4
MTIVVRPAARRDLILQVGYLIDEQAYRAAERFPVAVEEAFHQIQHQPGIGSPVRVENPKLQGLRSWPIPGFEDLRIYYVRRQPDVIRVLRVLHGKRHVLQILAASQD